MNKKNEKIISFTNALKFVTGIISWVVLVILVIIAVMLVYYFLATKIYGEKGENYKPAFSLYTILSASMEPNINVFDVIVDVNVKKPEDIKVGDVITFISSSNLTTNMTITHRVIEVVKDGENYSYKTQGDANLIPDNTNAKYENVLGKVIFKIPQLGRIQDFLGQKGGWLVVIVIPALGVIISDIIKIFRLSGAKTSVENLNTMEEKAKEHEEQVKAEIENNLFLKYSNKNDSIEESQPPDNIETYPVIKEISNEEEKSNGIENSVNNPKEESSINANDSYLEIKELPKEELKTDNSEINQETIEQEKNIQDLPQLDVHYSQNVPTEEVKKDIPFELPKLAKKEDNDD